MYQPGLHGIDNYSHIIVLYWKDLSSTLPTDDALSSPRSFSLFLQGIWIHSGISLSTVSTQERGLATIRLIVQFNFALHFHLLGIQHFAESRSGVSNYQHVCHRYQAVQLALDYLPFIPKSTDFGMLMLAVALKFQACIYSELDLLDHASSYWSIFSTALETMIKNSLGYSKTNFRLRIVLSTGSQCITVSREHHRRCSIVLNAWNCLALEH